MRAEFRTLEVAAAGNDGSDLDVRLYIRKWVQVGPFAGSGSLDIEVTLDGIRWVKVQTGITAAGLFEVAQTCRGLRIHTTSLTGAAPVVTFAGFNARSE